MLKGGKKYWGGEVKLFFDKIYTPCIFIAKKVILRLYYEDGKGGMLMNLIYRNYPMYIETENIPFRSNIIKE